MSTPAKTFTALLEPDGTQLRWVVARIPFDVAKTWPVRNGRCVRGEIEGFAFRTSLFPDPRTKGHLLLVNKKMQAGSSVRVGDRVRIRLEPDLDERPVEIPLELTALLKTDRGLRKSFDALGPSMRREIGKWVGEPKGKEGRLKRAERIAERLLLAIEGERELPPVLRLAFEREPRALAGWKALTPTQRRNHLLGIFHYQGIEARERRAAKAVDDALRAAEKVRAKSNPL